VSTAGGLAGIVLVATLAACSGSGGGTAAPTTTTTAPTTTSEATTTTLSPEAQVKAAYLAYWQTIDRLSAAPNPDDPQLASVATDPVLSSARDVLRTSAARQERTVTPPNGRYSHVIQSVRLADRSAVIGDCSIDDQVVLSLDGQVLDGAVTTKQYEAVVLEDAAWKVSDVRIVSQHAGATECAG
jgi:hypothetical protein